MCELFQRTCQPVDLQSASRAVGGVELWKSVGVPHTDTRQDVTLIPYT